MTTEEIKVKNWLQRAFYADKKMRSLEMLLKASKMHAEGLSMCGDSNNKGKSDTVLNGTETAFLRVADTECKYSEQKRELENISGEISDAVALLHDEELETVLIHRYLLFHTIEQTAELMHYSRATVKRKQNEAIKKLIPFDLV